MASKPTTSPRPVAAAPGSLTEAVANQLMNVPAATGGPLTDLGNVATLSGLQGQMPGLTYFSVTLDNTSSSPLRYIIGDPDELIAANLGGVFANPSATSADGAVPGSGVLPMKRSFAANAVAVGSFNYTTSSNAQQFNQSFMAVMSDLNGNMVQAKVPIALAPRNNQFNDLLQTINLTRPIVLFGLSAIVVTVLAGETVTLDFVPWMAAGRQ